MPELLHEEFEGVGPNGLPAVCTIEDRYSPRCDQQVWFLNERWTVSEFDGRAFDNNVSVDIGFRISVGISRKDESVPASRSPFLRKM